MPHPPPSFDIKMAGCDPGDQSSVGRLGEYQHPKHVLFIDAFPRTSLGKVQKAELSRLVRDILVQEPSGPKRQTPPQAPLAAAP